MEIFIFSTSLLHITDIFIPLFRLFSTFLCHIAQIDSTCAANQVSATLISGCFHRRDAKDANVNLCDLCGFAVNK